MTEENYQLSEYELQRLERIKKNEAYLESLGLHNAKQQLMAQATRKVHRKPKKVAHSKPSRRSNRVQKKNDGLVMLSYAGEEEEEEEEEDAHDGGEPVPQIDPDTDGRPTASFRRARRSSYDHLGSLTDEEKAFLAKNAIDDNYLTKFREFLVYHNKISEQNVRNVMKQVTKLATGQGVRYESPKYGWKPDQVFQKGVKITPLSDFVELLDLAAEAEEKWGRDHGNGWLLSHPLKKMLLFQQFCLQNPDFLSAQCRLKDYYADDYGQAEETVTTDPETSEDDASQPDAESPVQSEANIAEKPAADLESKAIVNAIPKKRVRSTDKGNDNNKKKMKVDDKDEFIGCRMAKAFEDGKVYEGTVTKCRKINRNSQLWWIAYDDGDAEEMNRAELQAAIRLHEDRME